MPSPLLRHGRPITSAALLLILVLGWPYIALASEPPPDPLMRSHAANWTIDPTTTRDFDGPSTIIKSPDLKAALEHFSRSERSNSEISINLPRDAVHAARVLAEEVSSLWNSGNYDAALKNLDLLSLLVPSDDICICGNLRSPLESGAATDFHTDVRIGDYSLIRDLDLDVHRESSTIFIVLLTQTETQASFISINRSTDRGLTWHETAWVAWTTAVVEDLDIAVITDKCFIGYFYRQNYYLHHATVADGHLSLFTGGSYVFNAFSLPTTDTLLQTDFVSNQDFAAGFMRRIYVAAITKNHILKLYWDDEVGESFTEYTTNVTDADRGLSICLNEGWSDYFLLASYIDTNNVLQIDGTEFGPWDNLFSTSVGSSTPIYTSIGAWKDTIHCAYEYMAGHLNCRYRYSLDGGHTFYWGMMDDTSVTAESPAISCREGGGVGYVYRFYTSPRQGRYCWRPYTGWPWHGPDIYADNAPYYNQPSIEYLGAGQFGIAYLTVNTPVIRGAYFDHGGYECCVGNRGNFDGSFDDEVDLEDLTILLDHLFVSLAPLDCWEEGNLDESLPEGPGSVSLGDLTIMIDHLFISLSPTPPCP